jgi:ABC-type nitrate/sulfonate/bicarbonate transport system permease component
MKLESLSARALQIGFVVAILLAWLWVSRTGAVNPIFLPHLERVLEELYLIIATGVVFTHLEVTVFEILSAYAIATVAGLGVGYAIGRSRRLISIFEPLLASVFAVPIIIFLPLFILFFGIGANSKIAFGATYAFFPIALNTIGGIGQVDNRFITVARSLGATDRQMFWRVMLPCALPVIVSGIRIAYIIGFLSIIGAEMIAGLEGLGSQIVRLAEGMNTAEMFSYVLFVIVIATLLNAVLSAVQRRFAGVGARA